MNNTPKNLISIALDYSYKIELVRFNKGLAYIRIYDPYYVSPYAHNIYSCLRTYSYCKRLFDSIDIRYKI